jgi:hypothetical protein
MMILMMVVLMMMMMVMMMMTVIVYGLGLTHEFIVFKKCLKCPSSLGRVSECAAISALLSTGAGPLVSMSASCPKR